MTHVRERCLACKGSELVIGVLRAEPHSTDVRFKPDDARLFVLWRDVAVAAVVCKRCGHLELVADTRHLEGILRQS